MTPNGEHLGDEIEAYALGLLDDAERARIDAHAGGCGPCSGRLGRAEAVVAQLVDATIRPVAAPATLIERVPVGSHFAARAPMLRAMLHSATAWATAAAVTFAVVAGVFAEQNARLRTDIADDGAAFHAMVDSHFSHAQFHSLDGVPLTAKVVYERHGGWYEIIAHGIDPQSRVAIVRGATVTPYSGGFNRRDDVLTLALPSLGAVTELRLIDSRGRTTGLVRPSIVSVDRPATQ